MATDQFGGIAVDNGTDEFGGVAVTAPQGFLGREKADIANRANQINQAGSAYQTGDKSLPRAILDIAGSYTGGIGDTVANAAGSLARNARDMITDPGALVGLPSADGQARQQMYGDLARNTASGITDTAAGRLGSKIVGGAKEIAANYPDTTAVAGDLLNIASVVPVARGAQSLTKGAAELAPTLTKDELSGLASKYYKAANEQGGVLHPTAVDSAIDKAAASIQSKTAKGQLLAGKDDLASKYIERLQSFKGQPLTLDEFTDFDKILGDQIQNTYDPIKKSYSPEGRNLISIRQSLTDAVENAKPTDLINPEAFDSYKTAKGLASTSFKQGDIDRIFEIADMSENPQQAIKAGFTRLVKGGMQGYTAAEKAAAKAAATTGIGVGALKLGGSRLLSGMAGFAGGGLPGAAAAEGVAYGLRQAAGKIQEAKGLKVPQLLSNRPVVQEALKPQDLQQAFIAAKAKAMRARVNAANAQPTQLPDPLALPAPETIYNVGEQGAAPSFLTNDTASQIQGLHNIGLTPDVLAAQKTAQVGTAYEQNAALQEVIRQQQAQALAQQYSEHVLLNNKPTTPMMEALQQAFLKKKAINGQK